MASSFPCSDISWKNAEKDVYKRQAYDNAVLELCGLKNGQIMEFDDFTDVVQKKILASGNRKEICGNCQWNSIC